MQSISTTDNQLYIVELRPPFERLQIQFMPEDLSWNRSADLPSVQIVGRNNPRYQLTGGEDQLSFKLDFYAEQEGRQDVMRKVRWLQSLTVNDGAAGPGRAIRLIWGGLFQKEQWLVKGVSAKLSQFMPNARMLPQQAYVDLALVLDTPTNRRLRDVRF